MPRDFIDMTGERYGTLVVIGRAGRRKRATYWRVRCDVCGDEKEMQRVRLLRIKFTGCKKCNARTHLKERWVGKIIDRSIS
jgi:hypothetical protein